MDEIESGPLPGVLAGILLMVVVGGVADLILDDPERWLSAHVILEVGLISASMVSLVYLWRGWWRTTRALEQTRRDLERRSEERDRWRESARVALEGLGEAIDRQFDAWGLTPAERDVALLLLKGYSHKRVAKATGRSERTVRQHAVSAYGKAGVAGRAELAAFFLEDLMLPDRARAGTRWPEEAAAG